MNWCVNHVLSIKLNMIINLQFYHLYHNQHCYYHHYHLYLIINIIIKSGINRVVMEKKSSIFLEVGSKLSFSIICARVSFEFIRQVTQYHQLTPHLSSPFQQGKSEGFDSCDRPSNLTQIGFKSSIFQSGNA